MDIPRFSRGEAIRFGWETAKNNLGFFIVLFLMYLVIFAPLKYLETSLKDSPVISVPLSILSSVLSLVVSMGMIRITLAFCDYQRPAFSELFHYLKNPFLVLKYFAASIMTGIIVLFGLLLLIVPGVIWAIQFQFAPYFIVDKENGPIEAMKNSSHITKGTKWELFLFGLLLMLINLAGILALLVGFLFTLPLTAVATAFVYRELCRDFQPVASA